LRLICFDSTRGASGAHLVRVRFCISRGGQTKDFLDISLREKKKLICLVFRANAGIQRVRPGAGGQKACRSVKGGIAHRPMLSSLLNIERAASLERRKQLDANRLLAIYRSWTFFKAARQHGIALSNCNSFSCSKTTPGSGLNSAA